jgi:hypothetical protein
MPTDIKLKNSVTATNAPTSLQQGEVAINITDKKVWVGNAATTPVLLLGSGADGTFTNLTVSGVASFADGTVSLPSITNIGDTNTGIYFPAADTIAFTEGGAESMRIDSSGRVLIGTTTVGISASGSTALSIANGTTQVFASLRASGGQEMLLGADSTNGVIFGSFSNNDLIFRTNNTERMRIDTSGNVGIGTSSPVTKLDIAATANPRIRFEDTGDFEWRMGIVDNSSFGFFSGGSVTERMRITSGGDLLVGATSQYGSEKLNVTSSSSANAARTINIYNSSASSTTKLNNVITRISSNGNGADNCINLTDNVANNYYFGGNNGGAYVVSSSNGVRLTVNATSWSSDSDERVKDIIEPISDAINKVSSLRAVIGKYKTDAEGIRRSFLIAQDVQKVLPEAVCDEQGTLMLAYTDVIPLLVAAIKEQQAIITDLKSRITALENK